MRRRDRAQDIPVVRRDPERQGEGPRQSIAVCDLEELRRIPAGLFSHRQGAVQLQGAGSATRRGDRGIGAETRRGQITEIYLKCAVDSEAGLMRLLAPILN